MADATITNGHRWQDGIDKRMDQNTEAINVLALKMQCQVDRLDNVLEAFKQTQKDVRDQGKYIDKQRWTYGLLTFVLVPVYTGLVAAVFRWFF